MIDLAYPGGSAVSNPNKFYPPVKGANNVGYAVQTPGSCILCEGGTGSKILNTIPGVNAIAGVHDIFQIGLQHIGTAARYVFNYPGMVPAAAITALGAIAPTAPYFVSGVLDD